jgi:sRNA-binding regulator protein Hfq
MSKLTQVIKINEALQKGDQETAIKLLKDLKKRAKDPSVVKFAEDKLKELGVRDSDPVKPPQSKPAPPVETRERENLETRGRRNAGIQGRNVADRSVPRKQGFPRRDTGIQGPFDKTKVLREDTGPQGEFPRRDQGPSRRPFTQKPRLRGEGQEPGADEGRSVGTQEISPRPRSPRFLRPGLPGDQQPGQRPFKKRPFKKKQGFKRKPLTPEEMARKEAARNLVNAHQISFTGAYQIIDGKLTLEEYQVKQAELMLRRAALEEKKKKQEERKAAALKLAEEHQLNPSITYQIVDGRFTLEEYLKLKELKPKKLMIRRRKEGIGGWFFQQLRQNQTPLVFALYDGQTILSPITEIEKYDFRLGEQTIPKLHVTHCYEVKQAEKVKERIQINEEVKAKALTPALKPTDRYLIPDKTLESCQEGKSPITFTTLGGEVIRGLIEWADSFQVKLMLQDDVWVTVFRHGVYEATFQESASEAPEQGEPQSVKTPVEIPIEKISVELAIHQNAQLNPQITGKVREQTKTLGKIPRPIWVAYDKERDKYILLDGFRRLTIAQELGLATLPAIIE